VKVSESPVQLGTMLWGVSHPWEEDVFLHCRVMELTGDMDFEADCGGTGGFSGTGYIDSDGMLVGIHQSAHSGRPERESVTLDTTWTKTVNDCNVTQLPFPEECFAGLFRTIELVGLNPRATIGRAAQFFELLQTNSSGVPVFAPPSEPCES
jgi:hypothetical protein